MDFSELSKDRFSVRKFSDRPIPRETLVAILEAGVHAGVQPGLRLESAA